jgi:hypothetical protein
MKRLLLFIVLSLLLFAGCQREELLPTEIKVKMESLTSSRARFTVAPANPHAYYTYILVSEQEETFDKPAAEICKNEILDMEDAMAYFQNNDFLDIYFYQGSRQFNIGSLHDDLDFKFIVFQINPKTHELLGEPVVTPFHTKPATHQYLQFQVDAEGDLMTITPSDDNITYFWQYEEDDLIYSNYGGATSYLYSIAGMYQEYGFMDWSYYSGPTVIDFSLESDMQDGVLYTLVICGCEEGEFTTISTIVKFRYQPGNIEVLEILETDEW